MLEDQHRRLVGKGFLADTPQGSGSLDGTLGNEEIAVGVETSTSKRHEISTERNSSLADHRTFISQVVSYLEDLQKEGDSKGVSTGTGVGEATRPTATTSSPRQWGSKLESYSTPSKVSQLAASGSKRTPVRNSPQVDSSPISFALSPNSGQGDLEEDEEEEL